MAASRRLGLLAAALLIAHATPSFAKTSDRISLVVIITVDQLGAITMGKWERFATGGLRRLRSQGAYFVRGVFEYASTETSAGHGTIATGAWPSVHGLVSNYWFDRTTGARIGCIEDPEHKWSPHHLNVPTLADALRLATDGRAKTISVSIKDRAGIVVAGWRPTASVFYDDKEGRFREASWYKSKGHDPSKEPEWLREVEREKGARASFGIRWDRLRADLDYEKLAAKDDAENEAAMPGLGRVFPRTLGQGLEGLTPPYYGSYGGTPAALEALFSLAKAALAKERLGKRGVVDLLSIGVTSLDYAGHWWSPESQEAFDLFLRLDRALGDLIGVVEHDVGAGTTLFVLTGDHGVVPTPERSRADGLRAERVDPRQLIARVNRALALLPKKGVVVEDMNGPRLYLRFPPGDARSDRLMLARAAAKALMDGPEILDAHAYADLDQFDESYRTLMKRSMYPGREADVMLLQRPFDLIVPVQYAGGGTGSDHGSPYLYDQTVPILIMGPGVKRGEDRTPYAMTRLAPTIAALLEIDPPAAAHDPPLPIIEHFTE
jgi:predicted AlkP superfamily pyrophosphatase or phosphodiesterase